MQHLPVLADEIVKAIQPKSGQVVLDGTVGYGGHAKLLLASAHGPFTYIGLDRDEKALAHCQSLFAGQENVHVAHANYAEAPAVLANLGIDKLDAVLLDLGASSPQFDQPQRGFSFQFSGPLDMRFDQSAGKTAAEVLNTYKEQDLARVIRDYGEERFAKRIAKKIVERRREQPFTETLHLVEVVEQAIPRKSWPRSIHPATRTFQALRIEVNNELELLKQALPQLILLLKPGGRIAVISFHSLEDRIVKQTFKKATLTCVCPPEFIICTCKTTPQLSLVNKKPIVATDEEQKQNPRSRSAKLRIAQKV